MMRLVFHVFLALVLFWASGPMAVARASMAGSVTICTGDGVRVVTLDAKGNPVATHACPDCSLAAPALLPVPAQTNAVTAPMRNIGVVSPSLQTAIQATLGPSARGPPTFV